MSVSVRSRLRLSESFAIQAVAASSRITLINTMGNIKNVSEKMSERLLFVANLLREESSHIKVSCVADVGCDHGYVSIYLVQSGIADSAIAMDVKKDPLKGASENIADYGLSDKIEVRLSDGLIKLKKGEAQGLVIAGMGGPLMIRILEDNPPRQLGIKVAVLQPQSEIPNFRKFLSENGFLVIDEKIIIDEGKYYFPMKVAVKDNLSEEELSFLTTNAESVKKEVHAMLLDACDEEREEDIDLRIERICGRYGALNILRKEELLKEFLLHGKKVAESILKGLDENSHAERTRQVREELEDINTVLRLYK